MLVYLDTAELAELDRLDRSGDPVVTEFFRVWAERQYVLALSRTHAEEMAQLEDMESLGKRLGMLERFPTLAFNDANHDWVSELEIRAQTLQRLNADESNPYRKIRDDLFPICEPGSFWRFVLELRPHVLAARTHREQAATLENRELHSRRMLRKVAGKRPKLPAITDVDPLFFEIVGRQYNRLMEATNDPFSMHVRGRLQTCRGRKLSRRQALLCIYGLEEFPAAARAPDEDLSMLGWLKELGERYVHKWCVLEGFPSDAVTAALHDFDPYAAPGISSGRAVYRGWRKSDNRRKPGDHSDGEHILAAAHTDHAFVDSRTATFIEQSRRSEPDLLSPCLQTVFHRSGPVESVLKALTGSEDIA